MRCLLCRAFFARVLWILFAGFALTPAFAQTPIKVATRIIPPLVTRAPDGTLTGFTIDLWRAIAKQNNQPFDFVVKANLRDLLDAVKNGEADLGAAAISITSEREATFDFSQPILESGLQILVRDVAADTSARDGLMQVLTTPALYQLLGILFLLALLPAPFIWWFERRHAEGIVDPDSKRNGLMKATWWSMATLAGQAEEMPRSAIGRIVAIFWMFASVLFISYFTATTTTILTVRQLGHTIRGPGDLQGRVVATVTGTTAAQYLADEGIRTNDFATFDAAANELQNGSVDALVYDAPVLLYYASHDGRGKVQVVGPVFRKADYGILFASGSALRKPVNAALLKLRETGAYRTLHANWFGQE